jgi:hypothetical protein
MPGTLTGPFSGSGEPGHLTGDDGVRREPPAPKVYVIIRRAEE